jgi:ATP-dependent RNA helicase RhlB
MSFLKKLFRSSPTQQKPSEPDASASVTPSQESSNNKSQPSQNKNKNKKPSNQGKKAPKKEMPPEVVSLPADFAELNLPLPLQQAIQKLGFQSCTPVQKEALPHSLDGADIIAQAQTGTGKTAAFLLSIITYHLENPEHERRPPGTPFSLVIAPTRELVMQIASDAEQLSEYADFDVVATVGGIDYEKQKTQLLNNVDLVIATPGRLLDFCRSRVIDLSRVEMLVIDEADRMLSMGFIPDVKAIIQRTPKKQNRQTQLFSATFSEDIKRLSATWTLDPVHIDIAPDQVAVDSVEQLVYLTSADQKYTVLYNLIMSEDVGRVIVFVNRRDQTRMLEEKLDRHNINSGLLTGEVPQKKRISTLDKFKSGEIKVLVATDVAGRGIHVDGITHVVNYNLPEDSEDYVHRIGRTGRAGADGVSISLACEDDSFMLPNIEALLGDALTCMPPPEELLLAPPPYSKPPRPKTPRSDSGKRRNNDRNSGRGNDRNNDRSRHRGR